MSKLTKLDDTIRRLQVRGNQLEDALESVNNLLGCIQGELIILKQDRQEERNKENDRSKNR